jgi:hypothetical protein
MPLYQVQGSRNGTSIEVSFSRTITVDGSYSHATDFTVSHLMAVAHGFGFFDKHSDTPLYVLLPARISISNSFLRSTASVHQQ